MYEQRVCRESITDQMEEETTINCLPKIIMKKEKFWKPQTE